MAKRQGGDGTPVVVVKNLSPGPRDYPLKNGGSIYLPPRGKGIKWPEISPEQVSEALQAAKKKGLVDLIDQKTEAEPAAKEAAE